MYLTEEEAKKKWCPMVRWFGNASKYEDVFENRGLNSMCIACECMMWRGKQENREVPLRYGETGKRYEGVDVGYCGLGGKP